MNKLRLIWNVVKFYPQLKQLLNSHFFKRNMCIGHGCYFEETGIWLKNEDILYLKSIGLLNENIDK